MNSLKEFQEQMPNGLDSIAVDITGFCNAKCKYCPSGSNGYRDKRFVEPGTFDNILKKLVEYKFWSQSTNFHIYSLGEPCLHPQINELLCLLSKYNIRTVISTNASVVPAFNSEGLASVNRFLISMPGFSQESYDKIHGFNFEKIKSNIIELRTNVAQLSGGRIPFDMSYHIYQFNEAEMVPAREFCNRYDIRFAPNYAVMMDKDKCLDYATGKMSYEELKDISKDIFLGVLDQQMKDAPYDYCDVQHSFLSVTIDGDIRLCGGFNTVQKPEALIGNILTDPIDDIISRKYHHPRCDQCIQAGLTMTKGYECKVYPDGYYAIMKENDFIFEHLHDDKLAEKLQFMKLVRQFETEGYSSELKDAVWRYVEKNNLQADIKEITRKYTRFGEKTYQVLVGK